MKLADGCILDTSVLLSLYHLKLIEQLKLLYNEVRIPQSVEMEFLNLKYKKEKEERFYLLNKLYEENAVWFKKCNVYSSDLVEIYRNDKLDKGESEVLAQNQELGGNYVVLIDEKRARKKAKSINFKLNGTLYILACLDLKIGVCKYEQCVEELKRENIGRFSDDVIKEVYAKVKEEG
ncbi:MAG: hypothetical protein D6799_02355 [Bacteroidetes bacterium]|nr:MAG: hypothetical protein D6799_02355 [Bacteroidota bacterium]